MAYFPAARPGASAPPIVRLSAAGDVEQLGELLRQGAVADLDEPHEFGSPLCWAAQRGHTEACRLLLRHGADPKYVNDAGMGPLTYAVLGEGTSHSDVVSLLLEHGVRDAPGDDGMTCLMAAAGMGELGVVRMLWEGGDANPSATCDGLTARDLARHNGHSEVASFLRDAAAELAAALQPQGRVRVVGLAQRSDLNGQTGTVISTAPPGGRVAVRLEGGEQVRIKPEALRPARASRAAPAEAAPAPAPGEARGKYSVCWLKPAPNGETYLPTLLSAVGSQAVFKKASESKLREFVDGNGMSQRKCLIPQLVGEPLVLWLKVQPPPFNGLATALASYWTADGPKGVCGTALLVRSTRSDGMPTADVFGQDSLAQLERMLFFINDATLPHSCISLRDRSVRDQLVKLWPAYGAECDTLVGGGPGGLVRIDKYVGGNTYDCVCADDVAEYLADPTKWVASRRPADAEDSDD